MSNAVPIALPYYQFFDVNGVVLKNGSIHTYAAGTLNNKATFTDSTGAVQNPNPVPLDSAGRVTLWGNGFYDLVLMDSLGNVVDTMANVPSFTTTAAAASSYFQSFSGNGTQTAYTLSTNLGTDPNAIMVFMSVPSLSQKFSGTSSQTVFTLSEHLGTDSKFLQVAISVPAMHDILSGTGSQTVYTLSENLGTTNPKDILVFVANLPLASTAYTISGTTLTFSAAPASGSNNIQVVSALNSPFLPVDPANYTISGTTLTFTQAPVTGTNNVWVRNISSGGFGVLPPTSYTLNGTALTFAQPPVEGTNNILVFAPSTLVGAAASSAAAADASATIATSAAATANADVVLTHADVVATHADVVLTHADVVLTHADVVTANASAATATTQAGIATTQAGLAAGSATAAAASALTAAGAFISTSTTSNTIGTGSKTWTIGANLAILPGVFVIASQNGTPANYNLGQVTAYNSSTGSITVNVGTTSGSGTITNWNFNVCGSPGTAVGALLIANNLSDLSNVTTAVSNLAAGINGQTYGGTSINGANDALVFYSAANTATRKMAVQDLFRTIDGLTSKATPVGTDELVIYDVSGAAPKKILISALPSSGGGSELVLLGTGVASASASVAFTSLITSAYTNYLFIFEDIVLATGATFGFQVSTNNGSTWVAGTNNAWQISVHGTGTTTITVTANGASVAVALTDAWAGSGSIQGELTIFHPLSSSTSDSQCKWCVGSPASGNLIEGYGVPGASLGTVNYNAIQFLPSTSTITSGKIYMYGIKNT